MPTYCHTDSTDVIENDYMFRFKAGTIKVITEVTEDVILAFLDMG
jgi:hypothetical protein